MNTLQARNEAVINAPIENLWAAITDINTLHKINPGVIKASGRMDRQGETRKIINGLMMKRMIRKAQEQILSNLRLLTEK